MICRLCKKNKSKKDFHKRGSKLDSRCKKCISKYNIDYQKERRDQLKQVNEKIITRFKVHCEKCNSYFYINYDPIEDKKKWGEQTCNNCSKLIF